MLSNLPDFHNSEACSCFPLVLASRTQRIDYNIHTYLETPNGTAGPRVETSTRDPTASRFVLERRKDLTNMA
jgi:hypothetical protein